MNIYFLTTIFALNVFQLCSVSTKACPSAQLLSPCVCINENINCGGNSYYDLKLIFTLLSDTLNETEKHFREFHLNNTAINELVMNVFHEITFDYIIIENALNLTKINSYAFLSSNCVLKEFRIHNSPVKSDNIENNLFNAINSMQNIAVVGILNISITTIPSHAFTLLKKLRILHFRYNVQLKTIGNYAFYALNNLEDISFSGNPIESIPDYVFSFHRKGNQTLYLSLVDMPFITNKSFSSLTFANIKYPFEIRFGSIGLTFLDRTVFEPILLNGNTINFVETVQLECDCRMQWIYEKRADFEKLVLNTNCASDGKSLFSDGEKFIKCID